MPAGPERIGPYRVLRELGRGGMGVVYEVERDDTGGRFALKTLTIGLESDPELTARFAREGQLAARLDHAHIVRTHAASFEGAQPWIVQDLLPGGSLRDRLRASGPFPIDEAVEVVRKVALGLAHAHDKGVLHRDVKPENVLFDDEGQPRLVDFGVARPTNGGASGQLTATGQVIGSPAFMAPEQAIGDRVDARADVHAAGALLHTLLCGDPPFAGASTLEVLEAVISKPPRPLRALRAEVPPAVESVVLRALAKRPDDRFPSAAALAHALHESRVPPAPRSTSRLVRALVATSVASTLVAALALVLSGRSARPPIEVAPKPTTVRPAPTVERPTRAPATTTPATSTWPGWGPTLAEPFSFELSWDERKGDQESRFALTLATERASVTGDQATVVMSVARVFFNLGEVDINYDSNKPSEDASVATLPGVPPLLRKALAARLQVTLDPRTGEVVSVVGMPNHAERDVSPMAVDLVRVLHDHFVRSALDNVMHLFPAKPGDTTLFATAWFEGTVGLRGTRTVRRSDTGGMLQSLGGHYTIKTLPGYTFTGDVDGVRVSVTAQLDAGRVVGSDLQLEYRDLKTAEHLQRTSVFRFRPLTTPRSPR